MTPLKRSEDMIRKLKLSHCRIRQFIAQFHLHQLSSKCMETLKEQALHASGQQFIQSILSLKLGVAAFDCDGTLWSGDAGETFFDWEIKRNVVSPTVGSSMRLRYAGYKAGKVSEDDMC